MVQMKYAATIGFMVLILPLSNVNANQSIAPKEVTIDLGPYKGCIEVTITEVDHAKVGDDALNAFDLFEYRMKGVKPCQLGPGQSGIDVVLDVGDLEAGRVGFLAQPIRVPSVGKTKIDSLMFPATIREQPKQPVFIRFKPYN